jgi:hypothetical protein
MFGSRTRIPACLRAFGFCVSTFLRFYVFLRAFVPRYVYPAAAVTSKVCRVVRFVSMSLSFVIRNS